MDASDFDIEFTEEQAQLVKEATSGSYFARRCDRVRAKVPFRDLVDELEGTHSLTISCPFHGRDSRPSFYIYPHKNNGFCFGCPEGEGYYDSLKYAAKKLGVSRLKAVEYLEKKFSLPPLETCPEDFEEEEDDEEDPEEETFTLTFENLSQPFIEYAGSLKSTAAGPVRVLMRTYWEARPQKGADPTSSEELMKAMKLARILGSKRLQEIKKKVFSL